MLTVLGNAESLLCLLSVMPLVGHAGVNRQVPWLQLQRRHTLFTPTALLCLSMLGMAGAFLGALPVATWVLMRTLGAGMAWMTLPVHCTFAWRFISFGVFARPLR